MIIESQNGYDVAIIDGRGVPLFQSAAGVVTIPAISTPALSVAALSATALTPPADWSVQRFSSKTFAAAAVRALNAPAELVAAPGAGLALIFDGAVLFYDYGGSEGDNEEFTIGTASGLAIKYTDGSGAQVGESLVTGFLDQTADKTRWVQPWSAASGDSSIVPVANSPLVLQMLTADVTDGDGCVLKVRTYYRVVPTVL